MASHSRTVSRKRLELFREDGYQLMVQVYRQSDTVTHYDIYPASLKYSRHGLNDEWSGYYPLYQTGRCGVLREDTFQKLVADGILVDKTPQQTLPHYKFYTFPDQEIALYGDAPRMEDFSDGF